jgi:hypothetical protein
MSTLLLLTACFAVLVRLHAWAASNDLRAALRERASNG